MIQLHFETVGACDARCVFCCYDSEENRKLPKRPMPMPLFQKIIDDAATIPQIEQVAFAGLAEPLMDPHIAERIAYTKKARPNWRTEMYTNGARLTPERFEAIKVAGLDILVISLNATSPEQHEKIMGLKGKYDLVCAHADYAIAHKGSMTHIDVRAVVTGDTFTEADAATFLRRWGVTSLGGYGKLISERNWAGANRTVVPFDPNSCCSRALEQISVHRDGRVNRCCYDPLSKYSFGDLKTQTIREIYNSEKYVDFRLMHHENRVGEDAFCAGCSRV
jgi:radical SAM protein with 4Fe4S-binding SPASM domain